MLIIFMAITIIVNYRRQSGALDNMNTYNVDLVSLPSIFLYQYLHAFGSTRSDCLSFLVNSNEKLSVHVTVSLKIFLKLFEKVNCSLF